MLRLKIQIAFPCGTRRLLAYSGAEHNCGLSGEADNLPCWKETPRDFRIQSSEYPILVVNLLL